MKQSLKMRLALVPAFVAATTGSAFAAVPAEVTTALASIGTDALAVATVVLLAIVGIYAFKFLRKGL